MKITSFVILSLAFAASFLTPLSTTAATEGPYTYTVTDGKATITDFDSAYSGALSITNELGGYPVTRIGFEAFASCTSLASVTIPAGVTAIGDYAFADCTSLASAYFAGNVPTPAGSWIFSGAPATVYYLPAYASSWPSTYAGRPTKLWSPEFNPDGGAHPGASVNVAITCTTAAIRYTTDGGEPTETSPSVVSGGAVSVPIPGTLKARAWKDGMNPSAVKSADYTMAGSAWDAGYDDIGGGWRRLDWFGDYVPMGADGWIWHNKHGFFYVPSDATPESLWLYSQDMGWLWTGSTVYPFLFRHSDGAWLWFNGATNPRWFVNMATGHWESWP